MTTSTLRSAPVRAAESATPAPSPRRSLREMVARVHAVVLTIMGVPDYERYVRHLRDQHPDCPVPTEREFQRERLAARYERPGSRCC